MESDVEVIRETARRFAAEHLSPDAARWDREEYFPTQTFRRAAEMGFASMNVSVENGGLGLARVLSVAVFEELSIGCVSSAALLSVQNAIACLIDRYGTPEQRSRWLPGLIALDVLGSYCLTEPDAGSDATSLKTAARRHGDSYRISGVKQFISGAGASDYYIVMARTADGPLGLTAFLVEKGTPGLAFGRRERKMGWRSQPTAQVILDDCAVPAANRIGEEGAGLLMATDALNGARLNISACSLGPARAALEKALEYAANRQQFGKPIIDHQLIQAKLARMASQLVTSRMLTYRAARAIDSGSPQAPGLCAMAKWLSTDAGFSIVSEAMQIHGGYGYMCDLPFERWLRDLRAHQILEGTNEIMSLIVARELRRAALSLDEAWDGRLFEGDGGERDPRAASGPG